MLSRLRLNDKQKQAIGNSIFLLGLIIGSIAAGSIGGFTHAEGITLLWEQLAALFVITIPTTFLSYGIILKEPTP